MVKRTLTPFAHPFLAIPSLVPQVLIIKVKSATPLGVKGGTPGVVAFYGCTTKGLWLYDYKGCSCTIKRCCH